MLVFEALGFLLSQFLFFPFIVDLFFFCVLYNLIMLVDVALSIPCYSIAFPNTR